MIQQSFFTNTFHKKWTFLGEGCFSQVHASPCGGWVYKSGGSKDGTLNWLEWCYSMQRCGRLLPGMPEIDFLDVGEFGYNVCMRRYMNQPEFRRHYPDLAGWGICNWPFDDSSTREEQPFLTNWINTACEKAIPTLQAYYDFLVSHMHSGDRPTALMDDMHKNNIMWCPRTQCGIITDPSASSYYEFIADEKFQLQ